MNWISLAISFAGGLTGIVGLVSLALQSTGATRIHRAVTRLGEARGAVASGSVAAQAIEIVLGREAIRLAAATALQLPRDLRSLAWTTPSLVVATGGVFVYDLLHPGKGHVGVVALIASGVLALYSLLLVWMLIVSDAAVRKNRDSLTNQVVVLQTVSAELIEKYQIR